MTSAQAPVAGSGRGAVLRRISDAHLKVAGWVVCGAALLLLLSDVPVLAIQQPAQPQPWWYGVANILGLVGAPILGALIVSRSPRMPYGWVWLGLGMSTGLIMGVDALSRTLPDGTGSADDFVVAWAFIVALACVIFILLLFPDGRPPSRRWHWVPWAVLGTGAVMITAVALIPHEDDGQFTPQAELEGTIGAVWLGVLNAGVAVTFALTVVAAVAVPLRWRRADGVQRRQLKWFALGAAWFAPTFAVVGFAEQFVPYWLLAVLAFTQFAALQVAVGIAMLRHGLYDVDRVINRTLRYVTISVCLFAVYTVVVVTSSVILAGHLEAAAHALATAAVALLVLPVRTRVQKAVDRLTFGSRGDPYAVLAELGHRVQTAGDPESVLAGIVESVAVTLRLPYVAITLQRGTEAVPGASSGQPASAAEGFPLTHQGEQVGVLLAAPRSAREELTSADRRLLTDLAQHAGVAAHAFLLADDLRRSRARVLAAREEERRRLRRDLHDGLGPTLAAVALEVDAARRRVAEPDRVATLLAQIGTDLQDTIEDVRRLAHDLRPPVLDQFGLVEAIRLDARRLETETASSTGGLAIDVSAPATTPSLPAAIEVAAYRIVGEALTNVVRHSGAHRCVVRVGFDDCLCIEVTDDGHGIPPQHRQGVGLSSMVERAVEVGGVCVIDGSDRRGTLVRARLPLEAPT
ncbi:GAF domain-containing sensor histidine kinase [Cellulomonas fimi]|uniref:sensor histidine kinase n=1 Tax=Cellulomonas fimi TaxID=1708 RepID=UPI00234D8303|nr:GAF domain-containing sensor histidine kinase [Cellulomonas fimi]MDC7120621.1 GAF domain-containing sensor histidine kinase [Cellulomonas fimi]